MDNKYREQLLEELHNIHFAAFLTFLPSEMCFELRTMNSAGHSYSWIGSDDWNVYLLRSCNKDEWVYMRQKIQDGDLSPSDVEGTDYGRLIKEIIDDSKDIDWSELLQELKDDVFSEPNDYYCYYNSEENVFHFYATEEDLGVALEKTIGFCESEWDELDTASLEEWLELYEKEGQNIPCNYFDDY